VRGQKARDSIGFEVIKKIKTKKIPKMAIS